MRENSTTVKDRNYFYWLCSLIENDNFDIEPWMNVLKALYEKPFIYIHPKDVNRMEDGRDLFIKYCEISSNLHSDLYFNHKFVSILEMMIALAIRCENEIMSCIDETNHTSVWFFDMLESLGLIKFLNTNFDENEFNYIIEKFLNRDYEPDGKGGLFYIPGIQIDLRKIEIWYQMNWYLDKKYGIEKGIYEKRIK